MSLLRGIGSVLPCLLGHYACYDPPDNALQNEYDALNMLHSVLMNIINIVLGTVTVLQWSSGMWCCHVH